MFPTVVGPPIRNSSDSSRRVIMQVNISHLVLGFADVFVGHMGGVFVTTTTTTTNDKTHQVINNNQYIVCR